MGLKVGEVNGPNVNSWFITFPILGNNRLWVGWPRMGVDSLEDVPVEVLGDVVMAFERSLRVGGNVSPAVSKLG